MSVFIPVLCNFHSRWEMGDTTYRATPGNEFREESCHDWNQRRTQWLLNQLDHQQHFLLGKLPLGRKEQKQFISQRSL